MQLLNYSHSFIEDSYWELRNNGHSIGLRIRRPLMQIPKAALLFLPGRWHNAIAWAPSLADLDISHYLSTRGYIVATINYRSNYLVEGTAEQQSLAISSVQDYLSDIELVLSTIFEHVGQRRIHLMGFSMGAALAFLTAGRSGRASDRFISLIALDGGIKKPERSFSHNFEVVWERIVASTDSFSMVYLQRNPLYEPPVRKLLLAAVSSPEALRRLKARLPGIESFNVDGVQQLLSQDEWWPKRLIVEMQSIADYDFHPTLCFDRALQAIDCPILGVCSFPDEAKSHKTIESAMLTASSKIVIKRLAGWGHLEILCGMSAIDKVHATVLDWLDRHVAES